jgi:hypothetical protein
VTPEFRALVAESRRRQGLPRHLEDPTLLAQLAALALEPDEQRPDKRRDDAAA